MIYASSLLIAWYAYMCHIHLLSHMLGMCVIPFNHFPYLYESIPYLRFWHMHPLNPE